MQNILILCLLLIESPLVFIEEGEETCQSLVGNVDVRQSRPGRQVAAAGRPQGFAPTMQHKAVKHQLVQQVSNMFCKISLGGDTLKSVNEDGTLMLEAAIEVFERAESCHDFLSSRSVFFSVMMN